MVEQVLARQCELLLVSQVNGKQIPISPFDSAMVCPVGVGHTAVSTSIQSL